MTPKGNVDNLTWQKISRSVDKVDRLHDKVSNTLNFKDVTSSRIVLLGGEITEWRALLRHSEYLEHKNETYAFNIYGEILNSELINLSVTLKGKMAEYWHKHAYGTRLENIWLSRIKVLKSDEEVDNSNI